MLYMGYIVQLHSSIDVFIPQTVLVGLYDDKELAFAEVKKAKEQMLVEDFPVGSIFIGRVLEIGVNATINQDLIAIKN